jgi:hypothetical protein
MAVIKQSNRGQLEIFASQSFAPVGEGGGGGGGRADPQGRPMQIVPHYMKEAALNEVLLVGACSTLQTQSTSTSACYVPFPSCFYAPTH